MRKLFLALVAAFSIVPVLASAQQPGQLPRTTGIADSSLFVCSDSAKTGTKACKFADVQKRLAVKAFDSLRTTGNLVIGGTCTGCGGGGQR